MASDNSPELPSIFLVLTAFRATQESHVIREITEVEEEQSNSEERGEYRFVCESAALSHGDSYNKKRTFIV